VTATPFESLRAEPPERLALMLCVLSLDVTSELGPRLGLALGSEGQRLRAVLRSTVPPEGTSAAWSLGALATLDQRLPRATTDRAGRWGRQLFWPAVYEPEAHGQWNIVLALALGRDDHAATLGLPDQLVDEWWRRARRALDDLPFLSLLGGSERSQWDLAVERSLSSDDVDGRELIDNLLVAIARLQRVGRFWRWAARSASEAELAALRRRGLELCGSLPELAFVRDLADPVELTRRAGD
jgi:hypothetical protein